MLAYDREHAAPKMIVDLGRVLFLGPWEETEPHSSMVPIIGAGLDADIHLTIDGVVVRDRVIRVDAGVPRQVDARGGRLAVFVFDPQQTPGDYVDAEVLAALTELADTEGAAAWPKLLDVFGLTPSEEVSGAVQSAARLIMESSDENVAGAEIAAEVGYSLSHLQDMFRTQLGLSMRSYRMWQRFADTAANMATSETITDAAIPAGFYDAAHFANAFMATFGVIPSEVFSDELEMCVIGSGRL